MFDFKSMGAVASLMKNKDQLEAAGKRVKERIEALRVEGSAGGGVVRAVVSGKLEMISVSVDPAVGSGFGAGEDAKRMAENLIVEATNDAVKKARDEAAAIIQTEIQALGLDESMPGIAQALKGMLPG